MVKSRKNEPPKEAFPTLTVPPKQDSQINKERRGPNSLTAVDHMVIEMAQDNLIVDPEGSKANHIELNNKSNTKKPKHDHSILSTVEKGVNRVANSLGLPSKNDHTPATKDTDSTLNGELITKDSKEITTNKKNSTTKHTFFESIELGMEKAADKLAETLGFPTEKDREDDNKDEKQ